MLRFPSPLGEDMQEEMQGRVLRLFLPGSVLFGVALILLAEAKGWPLGASTFGFALAVLPLVAWALMGWLRPVVSWLVVVGYLALALAAPNWLGMPAAACLLAVPAGLAGLLLGVGPGLTVTLAGSIALLVGGEPLGMPDPLLRFVVLGALWAMQGLIWAAVGSASQAVGWWSASYEKMRELLEEARNQRVELKETQEDLVQANLELARVSERLRAMREVAEEARRTKEEFAANVSHELRTPLNMIIGFSEMIARAPTVYGESLSPKLLADIEIILSSSRHLASLVDDVLDLSQIDTGRMALSRERALLHDIVQAAAMAVMPLYESKGLYLETVVPEGLPPVFCDRVRIRQVILNLLSNAGRFAEQGGTRLTVKQEGAQVVVGVADTGPGISAEGQQRIFEPFSQADSSVRRRYGGSGLGLAISRRFVELHGGRMWLESEEGKGTTFYFSLPVDGPTAEADAGVARWFNPYADYQPRTHPSRAPKPRLVPRYVVMEGGDTLSRLLSRYHEEVEVVSTHSIDEAIDEVSRLPAHALVLNDPRLQSAPGLPERLAHLPYGTPVVVCWVPGRNEAAERLGLVRYLMKPVSREELLAALEDLPTPVRSILIVDDEPEALQLYGRILASAGRGYRVLRAPTGQRALALLRERRPDVMLLDLVMPGLDGYGVLREKSLDPEISAIPTLALSAQDPSLGPIASELLTISRSGGLYLQDLLNSIDAISRILAPPDRLDGPENSGNPRD